MPRKGETWRAWVKRMGGDIHQYDIQYSRFKRFKPKADKLNAQLGTSYTFDPKKEAAWNIVYGNKLYEETRKALLRNKVSPEKAYTKIKTENLINADGYLLTDYIINEDGNIVLDDSGMRYHLTGRPQLKRYLTFIEVREAYLNDKISLQDFEKAIKYVKQGPEFLSNMGSPK